MRTTSEGRWWRTVAPLYPEQVAEEARRSGSQEDGIQATQVFIAGLAHAPQERLIAREAPESSRGIR